MTQRRWLIIVATVVLLVVGSITVWLVTQREEPTNTGTQPPLVSPNLTESPEEPATSPEPTASSPAPTSTDDETVDPATVEGAMEVDGIWYVECSSPYAGDTEISDGICYLEGANDFGDTDQLEATGAAFMEQWMQLDTEESWDAREDRLTQFVTESFVAPFPELAWQERYDRAGTLPYRARILEVDIDQSVPPQLTGADRYQIAYLVTYRVEWTLPNGDVNTSENFGVWQLDMVDGLVDEVNEPDLVS